MIIVIDGPAGSGKSSTAKAIAKKLSIAYLDSGALYRALTWIFIQFGHQKEKFFEKLGSTKISFSDDNGSFRVNVDGNDITDQLRNKKITNLVSKVASWQKSRAFVNTLMQNEIAGGRYIAEGRDLGTAVFPQAEVKFFMKADAKERARRRYKDLCAAGEDVSFTQVLQQIQQRDEADSTRDKDPLKKAPDAIEVDTTTISFDKQVEQMCTDITERVNVTPKSKS